MAVPAVKVAITAITFSALTEQKNQTPEIMHSTALNRMG
jgi:hypothetical protein